MVARDMFDGLRRRGFVLLSDGGTLRVTPASRLSDLDRAAIREHKDELLALLGAPDPAVVEEVAERSESAAETPTLQPANQYTEFEGAEYVRCDDCGTPWYLTRVGPNLYRCDSCRAERLGVSS